MHPVCPVFTRKRGKETVFDHKHAEFTSTANTLGEDE
jgi:hypothetical protein